MSFVFECYKWSTSGCFRNFCGKWTGEEKACGVSGFMNMSLKWLLNVYTVKLVLPHPWEHAKMHLSVVTNNNHQRETPLAAQSEVDEFNQERWVGPLPTVSLITAYLDQESESRGSSPPGFLIPSGYRVPSQSGGDLRLTWAWWGAIASVYGDCGNKRPENNLGSHCRSLGSWRLRADGVETEAGHWEPQRGCLQQGYFTF